jgi:hypothetical protein
MYLLAALMLSMTVLTTALLAHAVATDDQHPGTPPPALAGRSNADPDPRVILQGP